MNTIFLGGTVVTLPLPNVIVVTSDHDFARMLKLDPDAFGIFMAGTIEKGIETARAVRAIHAANPLYCLMYGPQANHQMITAILMAGADQVEKFPVDGELFLAQIQAILGRGRAMPDPLVTFGTVTFNPHTGDLTSPKGTTYLTKQQGVFLAMMLASPGRVITREYAIEALYGTSDRPPSMKILDVVLCNVRKRIAAISDLDFIDSVWGKGYRFVPEGFVPEVAFRRSGFQRVREAAE